MFMQVKIVKFQVSFSSGQVVAVTSTTDRWRRAEIEAAAASARCQRPLRFWHARHQRPPLKVAKLATKRASNWKPVAL